MGLIQLLEDLPDARRAQGQRYQLNYILVCSILSILCGARSYCDIHRFIKIHLSRLKILFGLKWKTAPAHTTLRDILKNLKKPALEWYFRQHSLSLSPANQSEQKNIFVAIDGKYLRGSFDHSNHREMVNLISAYCSSNDFILGHIETADKSNKIPAVQQLLNGFGLQGCVYTFDALHCQKNTGYHRITKKRSDSPD